MRIGVLGTGMVGGAIGSRLVALGHEVKMGSREAGNEEATAWAQAAGSAASEGTFAEAAEFGEFVFNCTSGAHSLVALEQAGRDNLAGKVRSTSPTRSTSPPAGRRRSPSATRTRSVSRSSGPFRRARS